MDLTPYIANLREDLANTAAAGDEHTRRAAALLSSALEPAGFPEVAHLRLEARDDRLEVFLFIRQGLFLGDFQMLVRAPHVDQCRGQARKRIAKQRVE